MGRSLFRWVDERLGTSHFARKAFDKIFPDHWSFMVGEIAMYCLVVLIVTGVYLLVLAIMNGFFGYSLLDDLLSGTGVRVGYSIALSIPVAGEWLAFLFFGGEFPNTHFITRFFVLHVLLLPALIVGLLGAHL